MRRRRPRRRRRRAPVSGGRGFFGLRRLRLFLRSSRERFVGFLGVVAEFSSSFREEPSNPAHRRTRRRLMEPAAASRNPRGATRGSRRRPARVPGSGCRASRRGDDAGAVPPPSRQRRSAIAGVVNDWRPPASPPRTYLRRRASRSITSARASEHFASGARAGTPRDRRASPRARASRALKKEG